MDGRGVAAALALGAQGVAMGTAFLACSEAGTSPAHRDARTGDSTVTRVLTGRHARAARTPVVDRLEASGVEPPDYPLPRLFLTEPPYLFGQGGPMSRSLPAGELVGRIEGEVDAVLATLTG
jgi:nitronate monooxygenase